MLDGSGVPISPSHFYQAAKAAVPHEKSPKSRSKGRKERKHTMFSSSVANTGLTTSPQKRSSPLSHFHLKPL